MLLVIPAVRHVLMGLTVLLVKLGILMRLMRTIEPVLPVPLAVLLVLLPVPVLYVELDIDFQDLLVLHVLLTACNVQFQLVLYAHKGME